MGLACISSSVCGGYVYFVAWMVPHLNSVWKTFSFAFLHLKPCTQDHRGTRLPTINISKGKCVQNCCAVWVKYVLTVLWMSLLFFKSAAQVQAVHAANRPLWIWSDQEIVGYFYCKDKSSKYNHKIDPVSCLKYIHLRARIASTESSCKIRSRFYARVSATPIRVFKKK